MSSYEVEIKCLLGGKESADGLLARMKEKDPGLQQVSSHKQLNHYFMGGDLNQLYENIAPLLKEEEKEAIQALLKNAKNFSLRTRQADEKVILVLKVSVDEGTSANTVGRIEFEAETPKLSLEELDQLVLKSGLEYQAKWSRERTEYKYLGANATIDKNAGYGYLAEFEKIINDEAKVAEVKTQLRKIVNELSLEELDQARLERMFAYYNANWQDYYGTDKVFVVE
ncbi:MAG: CYTH domain-containing protein [Candidatus Colwellbacteria bacterium]|nr:CYTH domain-containing protein [Candidatus Colwellbacteria bacterium]